MRATALSTRVRTNGGSFTSPDLLGIVLMLFLLSCVFDPADRALGLKVWLFLLGWGITLLKTSISNSRAGIPRGLLLYTMLFLAIPVTSTAYYTFLGSGEPYEGFTLLKGYLLITLAPLLVLNRIDLLPPLCAVLTALSLVIIAVFVILILMPELYDMLYSFGARTGTVLPDVRRYGAGVTLLQVYFVTSPMLAISIAYFFDRARSASTNRKRSVFWGVTAINATGMLLAGSRNNIIVSLMLPMTLWLFYAKNKARASVLGLAVVAVLTLIFADEMRAFFDPAEYSNSIKLALLDDYARILSDPVTLVLGRGLGAYDHWDAKGTFSYISELTYLELIRNFGLPGALVMVALLLFPIRNAFSTTRSSARRAVAIGYGFYLVVCVSNPNLFSSMGILILCVILGRIYMPAHGKHALPCGGKQ